MSSTLKESTKKKKHAQVSTNSAPKTASTVNGKAAHIKASQQKVAERRKREETDEDTEKDSEGHSDDSEFDDVDEVGMNRLMELLGDDGLDDIAKLQLGIIDNEEHEDEGGEVAEDDSEAEEEEEGREHEGSEQGENFEASGDSDALVDEEEQEIDLEDVSSIDEDVVPKQKLIINNTAALDRIRENIQLDPSLPWMETLAVSYDQAIEVDVNDDLKRELEFYKQALHGANLARSLAAKHQLPFTRPSDFYAEMVKSDAHMERIRQRLLDETAGIKRSEEKKREREGKKFGKQVQMEKIKERERTKKDMEDRIRGLKRKRKDALDGDEFDVELEDALKERPTKRHAGKGKSGPSMPRAKRDAKFGFGGKVGRRAKQNTKESTDSFGGGFQNRKPGPNGGERGKKGPAKRLGKSRRMRANGK